MSGRECLVVAGTLCFLGLMSMPVRADVRLVQVTSTDSFEVMGKVQPAQHDTAIIWLSATRASLQADDIRFLVEADAETHKVYAINDRAHSYFDIPLEPEEAPDSSKSNPHMEMTGHMMGNVEASLTPTEETKMVGDWQARKFDLVVKMAVGSMESEIWATTELDLNTDLFQRLTGAIVAQMPGMLEVVEKIMAVEGIPVETILVVNMMGVEIKSTTRGSII